MTINNQMNNHSSCLKRHLLLLGLLGWLFVGRIMAQAGSLPVSGTCGTCSWSIDADGVLTIAPENGASEGKLDDWMDGYAPWHKYAASIHKIVTKETIKASLVSNLFADCVNLEWLDLSGFDFSEGTTWDDTTMYHNCKAPYVLVLPTSAKMPQNLIPKFSSTECPYRQVTKGDELWNPQGTLVTSNDAIATAIQEAGTSSTFVQVAQLPERTFTVSSANQWITLCYPYQMTLEDTNGNSVAAYTCTGIDNKNMLVLKQYDDVSSEVTLPAYTPFLIYAPQGATLTATQERDTEGSEQEVKYVSLAPVPVKQTGNLLVGVNGPVTSSATIGVKIDSRNQYVLQRHGDVVAFYYVDADHSQEMKPYRCYLEVPSSSNVRPASLRMAPNPVITGIHAVSSSDGIGQNKLAGQVYDMQGRSVNQLQKGTIYICNGLKFIIK